MAERRRIGVTGPSRGVPWAWWATRWRLRRLGARPVHLVPGRGDPGEAFAGFVIGGGNDIDPGVYGGDPSVGRNVDPARDAFELAVLTLADRLRVPVLGICRGAQLINVHMGGTLLGDVGALRRHTSNRASLCPVKPVRVAKGSVLHDFLGATTTRVNSLHRQAVDRPGRGLRATAHDRDGIVQAVEGRAPALRLGVQWHPEYLPQRADQRRLFGRFLEACAGT